MRKVGLEKKIYNRSILPNGIRVVSEGMPHIRSASIGIWVNVGSKNEEKRMNGISHFIEHMLFKGTNTRTAHEIAEAVDRVGGYIGAFTGREYTCFYIKVAHQYTDFALELLSDMFSNSLFDEGEIDKEKRVVEEEIKMYEDTPDELIHDLFIRTAWSDHPLGQPVIGKEEVITSLTREKILSFFKTHYIPEQTIIAAAGAIKHGEIVELSKRFFGCLSGEGKSLDLPPPSIHKSLFIQERNLEQIHFCLGGKGLPYTSENRFSLYILNAILGGSMSSRLFEEIREKRGLAYAVYSYQSSHRDGGLFVSYVGTSPQAYLQVIELILKELARLKKERVGEEEIKKAKEQVKGGIILGLEDSGNCMSRIAKQEIYFGRHFEIDQILKDIDKVSSRDLQELAHQLFQPHHLSLASIGPLEDKRLKEVDLIC